MVHALAWFTRLHALTGCKANTSVGEVFCLRSPVDILAVQKRVGGGDGRVKSGEKRSKNPYTTRGRRVPVFVEISTTSPPGRHRSTRTRLATVFTVTVRFDRRQSCWEIYETTWRKVCLVDSAAPQQCQLYCSRDYYCCTVLHVRALLMLSPRRTLSYCAHSSSTTAVNATAVSTAAALLLSTSTRV